MVKEVIMYDLYKQKPNYIEVLHEKIYICKHERCFEYNPSFKPSDVVNCQWEFIEHEQKISFFYEISSTEILPEKSLLGDFWFGSMYSETHYENAFCIEFEDNSRDIILLLGKKNWDKKRAYKHKIRLPFTTARKSTIFNYDETSLNEYFLNNYPMNVTNMFHAFSYYKRKTRVIVVHRKLGHVFCVSVNKTNPLKKSVVPFYQCEVEYWSTIVTKKPNKPIKYEDSLENLSKQVLQFFHMKGISSEIGGKAKSDWILYNV